MIAPVIGGWIIELSTWRLVFVVQAVLGLIAVLGVIRLEESLQERVREPMWLLTFFFAFGRPPSNNLILEQVEYDVGSASSLMVFFYFITGACPMWFISLNWSDKVTILGWFALLSATVTLVGWLLINRFYPLKMPYQESGQKEVDR